MKSKRMERREEKRGGYIDEVIGAVYWAASTNVERLLRQKESLLKSATKRRSVSVRLSEVGVPRVQMRVKVYESDRSMECVD